MKIIEVLSKFVQLRERATQRKDGYTFMPKVRPLLWFITDETKR